MSKIIANGIQLDYFYEKEIKKQEMKKKRQQRQRRPLTPAIKYSHFVTALDLVDNGKSKETTASRIFSNARNRIALFLLYFSGMRVGTLLQITFSDLNNLFSETQELLYPISKKRDKKQEQIFVVSSNVYEHFIYGKYNLQEDYKCLISYFEKWADQNNIPMAVILRNGLIKTTFLWLREVNILFLLKLVTFLNRVHEF